MDYRYGSGNAALKHNVWKDETKNSFESCVIGLFTFETHGAHQQNKKKASKVSQDNKKVPTSCC
jgi:hypothetical protein